MSEQDVWNVEPIFRRLRLYSGLYSSKQKRHNEYKSPFRNNNQGRGFDAPGSVRKHTRCTTLVSLTTPALLTGKRSNGSFATWLVPGTSHSLTVERGRTSCIMSYTGALCRWVPQRSTDTRSRDTLFPSTREEPWYPHKQEIVTLSTAKANTCGLSTWRAEGRATATGAQHANQGRTPLKVALKSNEEENQRPLLMVPQGIKEEVARLWLQHGAIKCQQYVARTRKHADHVRLSADVVTASIRQFCEERNRSRDRDDL